MTIPKPKITGLRAFSIAVLVLFIAFPLWQMVQQSFFVDGGVSAGNYGRFFSPEQSRSLDALWGSVWISIVSVICAGLIGVPLAILFERVDLPAKNFLSAVATLPIVLPPLVGVFAFLYSFGESGIFPRLLQSMLGAEKPVLALDGVSGVIVVHAYSFYVYFFLFTRAAFQRLDGSVIEAARSLGSSHFRLYREIIFPQLWPAMSGAAIIVFMVSMASFTAPLIFAGDYRFLTVEIFNNKVNGDMPMAITQSVMLGAISLVFLFVNLTTTGRENAAGQKGVPLPPRPISSKTGRYLAIFAAVSASLLLTIPHLTIFLLSFVQDGSWTTQIFPDSFTFDNYSKILSGGRAARPVLNSARMALIATAANIAFAVAFAYWHSKGKVLGRKLSEIMIMLPWAIPGTVVAIALIVAFNEPRWFTGGQILVGTFWILPLAYFIRHLPVVYRSSLAAFQQLDRSQEEAAKSLGAGGLMTLRRVILPAVWPGVVAGALLATVMSLGEFVSSILIYLPSNRPISLAIFNEIRLFNLGTASAYGVFLTFLIFFVTFFSSRSGQRF